MIHEEDYGEIIEEKLFPVRFTTKSIKMAKSTLKNLANIKHNILRISVKGGGCSGLKYSLTFVKQTDHFDLITHKNGLKITIDIFSANYLINAKIDYLDNINESGFKFYNPNAIRTCSCGSSFTT
jgi:iron-sulfur cluster assembly protein